MARYVLFAPLEAKPDKGEDLAAFLKQGEAMSRDEAGTVNWYAVRFGPTSFAIFDTFDDEAGRDAHLNGDIAKALMAKADELLASPPDIRKGELIGEK